MISGQRNDGSSEEQAAKKEATPSALRARWGGALDAGFVAFPSILLVQFKSLNVTPTEFLVALNLISHWWEADRKPYPRVSTIARRLKLTPRTVQRALNRLRDQGLIQWDHVHVHNGRVMENQKLGVRRRRYDLEPLVLRADRFVAERQAIREAAEQRRRMPEIAT